MSEPEKMSAPMNLGPAFAATALLVGVARGYSEQRMQRLESAHRKKLEAALRSASLSERCSMFSRERVFERIMSKELRCALILDAMVATEGEWHRRYVDAFERELMEQMRAEELDLVFETKMREMDVVWTDLGEEIEKRLFAPKTLMTLMQEMIAGTGKARGRGEEGQCPSADAAVRGTERRARGGDKRWGRVFGMMLSAKVIEKGIEEGEYDECLWEVMKSDELARRFYKYTLVNPQIIDAVAARNPALVRQIVSNLIAEGYWLIYQNLLAELMEREAAVGSFGGCSMFGRIKLRYLLPWHLCTGEDVGEMLLELVDIVQNKDWLDGLLEKATRTMIRYSGLDELKVLLDIDKAVCLLKTPRDKEKMDEAIGERLEMTVGDAKIGDLVALLGMVPGARRVLTGLLKKGVLNDALARLLKKLAEGRWIEELPALIKMMPEMGKFLENRLGAKKWKRTLVRELKRLIRTGCVDDLQRFLELPRARALLRAERYDPALRGWLTRIVVQGCIGDLPRLLGMVPRAEELLKALADGGGLEKATAWRLRGLIACGQIDDLGVLLDTVSGAKGLLEALAGGGKMDDELIQGLEILITSGRIGDLEKLRGRVLRAGELLGAWSRHRVLKRAVSERLRVLDKAGRAGDMEKLLQMLPGAKEASGDRWCTMM